MASKHQEMAFAVVMVPYLLSDSLKLKALIIVILQLLLILLRRYVTDFTEVMNEMRLIINCLLYTSIREDGFFRIHAMQRYRRRTDR